MGHCLEKKSYRYSHRPASPAPPLKQYVIVMAIVGLFVPIFRAFYCTKWLGKKKNDLKFVRNLDLFAQAFYALDMRSR